LRQRRAKEITIRHSIKYAALVSVLGYALLVASALVVSAGIRVITGYYPSLTFFTLALITFRLTELHYGFLLAPPLISIVVTTILSKTAINIAIRAGIGLSSYYVVVALMFVIVGAGDFSVGTSIPWIVWAFVVGVGSSIAVDMLCARYYDRKRGPEGRG
jgi:hypothetical protein